MVVSAGEELAEVLPDDVELAVQAEPRGTADAVLAAASMIARRRGRDPLGDVPLVPAPVLGELEQTRARAGRPPPC